MRTPVPPDARIDATVDLPRRFRAAVRKHLKQAGVPLHNLPARFPLGEREKRETLEQPTAFASEAFERLVAAVLPHATRMSRLSKLHGPAHWRRVAENGERLCKKTPNADPYVVALFAALHDCVRDNDGRDPRHGYYAAKKAEHLLFEGVVSATDEQMDRLVEAYEYHNKGAISPEDPTVGVCFDADRLDSPVAGYSRTRNTSRPRPPKRR